MKTLIIYGSQYVQLNNMSNVWLRLFHKMMQKMPESQWTADAKAMLETYGKQVDFVDFSALERILK